MNEQTVTLLVAVVASTGFWTFLNNLIARKEDKAKPIDNVMLALGRDRLLSLNKHYREMGFIPSDEYENYISLGEAYIAAGGNSLVKKGFELNKSLPIKED